MQHILRTIILSCPVCLAAGDTMGQGHGGAIEGRSIAAPENWSAGDASEVITLETNLEETAIEGAASFRLEPR